MCSASITWKYQRFNWYGESPGLSNLYSVMPPQWPSELTRRNKHKSDSGRLEVGRVCPKAQSWSREYSRPQRYLPGDSRPQPSPAPNPRPWGSGPATCSTACTPLGLTLPGSPSYQLSWRKSGRAFPLPTGPTLGRPRGSLNFCTRNHSVSRSRWASS